MKELEYPYKREYILAKKKKLRNELMKGSSFLSVKIAILAGSTVNEIKDILELFLLNVGIKPEFYLSEYNKYYEDAVFENEKLSKFKPDIVYIFTTYRNINFDFDISTEVDEINDALKKNFYKYEKIWQSLKEKYNPVIIQNNFEYPEYRLLGNKDISDYHGFSNYLMRLNDKFYQYANTNRNFYICDINYISANYGLDKWHNEKLYALYKIPCDLFATPDISYNVANIIKSIYGKNQKSLILDLDNTLWGGVISEDGISKLNIGMETAEGEIYLSFQKYLKKLKSLGIILNVVSKNDEDIAINGIENTDGVLKKDDFLFINANWEPKHKNIIDISKKMNIGLDAFAFVDDNPMERDIVKTNLPQVKVADVDLVEDYIKVIDKASYFELTNYTAEDRDKLSTYKSNILREKLAEEIIDYNEYLKSLCMSAEIKEFSEKYYERISQLSNKSNQFNLTTKRYTINDIEEISNDKNYITLYGKLADKFGDNGIVSIFIGKIDKDVLSIELFLMSCRVLKRKMEFAMMDEIVSVAKSKDVNKIVGHYYKTEKNNMVKDLFLDFGFTKVSESENGDSKWELKDLPNYQNLCDVIKIN